MDYDSTTIPAGYDLARSHTPEVLDLWMNTIASCFRQGSVNAVLDLGCGTGRFSQALASRFNADVVGVVMRRRTSSASPGTVVEQKPGAGTLAAPGTVVDIVVARSPQ